MRRSGTAYGVSLAAVAVAVGVRLLLEPLLADRLPFVTLFAAVVFVAWYCGRGPALLALVVGSFAVAYFILRPRYSFGVSQFEYQVGLVLYGVIGFAALAMFDSLRKARQRAEDRLRESGERLRMALTAARMVAWQFDPSTGKVVVSDNAADVFGLPPGAPLDHSDQGFALVHPDDVGRHRATVRKAVEECGSYLSRYRMVRPDDGAVVWMEERGHAIREGPGKAVRLIGVVMDVTERKQAEEQFRAMAENIPQLAWMARPDGHIFWYNRRWYEYTGTTPDSQEGWGWESVHDPEVLPKVLERWKQCIATGEAFDMVFPLRGRDGTFRPFLTRVMPVKDAEGRVVQWFGTNTDIAEQRRAAEELRKLERRAVRGRLSQG